jgi:hypothetical protein
LYRDPVDVLISHLGHRGYHTIPGSVPSLWLGLSAADAQRLEPEQYIAAVLGRLCEAALAIVRDGQLTPIPYASLPDAAATLVAPLFGFEVGPTERARFGRAAERNAKNPLITFEPDPAARRRRATPAVLAAASEYARPAYEALCEEDSRGRA